METTLEAIELIEQSFDEVEPMQSELLDGLMEAFYTPADINQVIQEVAQHFFVIIAVIVSVYPIMYMFKRFIRYAEKAFDTGAVRELESGGLWRKMADGSLHGGLEKIAQIPAFKKVLRR